MSGTMKIFQNNMDAIVVDLLGHSEDLYSSASDLNVMDPDLDSFDLDSDEFKFTVTEEAPDGSGDIYEFEFNLLNAENRDLIRAENEKQAAGLAYAGCSVLVAYQLLYLLHKDGIIHENVFAEAYNRADHVVQVPSTDDPTLENWEELQQQSTPFVFRDVIKPVLINLKDRYDIYNDVPDNDDVITKDSLNATLSAADIVLDHFYSTKDEQTVKAYELRTMFAVANKMRHNLNWMTDPVAKQVVTSELQVPGLFFASTECTPEKYNIAIADDISSQSTARWARSQYKKPVDKTAGFAGQQFNLKNRLN